MADEWARFENRARSRRIADYTAAYRGGSELVVFVVFGVVGIVVFGVFVVFRRSVAHMWRTSWRGGSASSMSVFNVLLLLPVFCDICLMKIVRFDYKVSECLILK